MCTITAIYTSLASSWDAEPIYPLPLTPTPQSQLYRTLNPSITLVRTQRSSFSVALHGIHNRILYPTLAPPRSGANRAILYPLYFFPPRSIPTPPAPKMLKSVIAQCFASLCRSVLQGRRIVCKWQMANDRGQEMKPHAILAPCFSPIRFSPHPLKRYQQSIWWVVSVVNVVFCVVCFMFSGFVALLPGRFTGGCCLLPADWLASSLLVTGLPATYCH